MKAQSTIFHTFFVRFLLITTLAAPCNMIALSLPSTALVGIGSRLRSFGNTISVFSRQHPFAVGTFLGAGLLVSLGAQGYLTQQKQLKKSRLWRKDHAQRYGPYKEMLYKKYSAEFETNNGLVTVFAHGLGGNEYQGIKYHQEVDQERGFIQGPLQVFNFADEDNMMQSNLGQQLDVEQLDSAIKPLRIVNLVGVSRGAATIINYLGTACQDQRAKIQSAVLESPFDHMLTCVKHQCGLLGTDAVARFIDKRVMTRLHAHYDPQGLHPITSACSIAHHIPMLLIGSCEDGLTPLICQIKLYQALRKAGHPKVHLLILEKGGHANCLWGPEGDTYAKTVHAFYKQYGLPHDEKLAQEGQALFLLTQPTEEEVTWLETAFYARLKKKQVIKGSLLGCVAGLGILYGLYKQR